MKLKHDKNYLIKCTKEVLENIDTLIKIFEEAGYKKYDSGYEPYTDSVNIKLDTDVDWFFTEAQEKGGEGVIELFLEDLLEIPSNIPLNSFVKSIKSKI